MNSPDRFTEEPPHDVLAAEEFPMPAPDPVLHHAPVVLPEDPTGIPVPHDVLAAEEFPMPAPSPDPPATGLRARASRNPALLATAATLLGVVVLRLLRRS